MTLNELLSKTEFGTNFEVYYNDECIYDTAKPSRDKKELDKVINKNVSRIMLAIIEAWELPIMVIDVE